MKIHLAILLSFTIGSSSLAMDQMTLEISNVQDAPTRDTREMILKHGETEETFHVDRNVILTDGDFRDMVLVEGDDVSLLITFTEEGSKKFAALTKEMVGKRPAITADNHLLSAPVVHQVITGPSIQISGNLSKEKAGQLIAHFYKAKGG